MQAVAELEVYQAGSLTVVGFDGREILDQMDFAQCCDEVRALVQEHQCRSIAFDFTGVCWIPSALLGVLMSAYRQTGDVHLFNPSVNIREALEITKLDQILHVHDIEV